MEWQHSWQQLDGHASKAKKCVGCRGFIQSDKIWRFHYRSIVV